MVEAVKPIVTITGISGFIGAQVCLDFLKSGEYRVRGTVRDHKNEAKIAPLRKAFGEYFDQLELADADLLNAESLLKSIAGSTFVVHTASPFYFPENDEDVIKPAVEGTIGVLKACSAAGVKRCVITSSVAAVIYEASTDRPDITTGFYTESNWSNPTRPEGLGGYQKSKTLAERAAWDYQKSLPEGERFEITVINPCLVMGPTLIPGGFTSSVLIERFFNGSMTECPTNYFGYVDVRDVSKLHLEGLKKPEAANQRIIAWADRLYTKEVADILAEEFGPKGYKITTKEAEGERLQDANVSNEKAKALFGMEFISAKDAVIAMANSLIEHRVIQLSN